ncbi:MAG: cysteine desulfurase [Lentisphaeria bacterium]
MNAPASTQTTPATELVAIREQFPTLEQTVHGKPLVYLDNAATSQKPWCVINAIAAYYEHDNSNVHRGVHELSQRATAACEAVRDKVRAFINAEESAEILFTSGATEAINLVASSYGAHAVGSGDEIIISTLEHHSNIVPWQLLCERSGAVLRVIPISDAGDLDLDAYRDLLTERTRLVAVGHVSNALGTVNPIREIIDLAHDNGTPVLIDGAQAIPHMPVDVQALDCDFYTFSGHKMYGPTGVGVLYGKRRLLDAMPPYQGGGDMISSVRFEGTTYNALPYKFEAGTPNIAGIVGFGTAVDFVQAHLPQLVPLEANLMAYAESTLSAIDSVRIVGAPQQRVGALSFLIDNVHPHDIGTVVDLQGIAIRVGHHCAQPLMERLGLASTARASFGIYNTTADIDRLAAAIPEVMRVFA